MRSFFLAGVVAAACLVALNAGGVEPPGCAEAQAQGSGAVEGRLDCRTACLATTRVPRANVARRGRGLRFGLASRARVDLVRFASGRRPGKPRRVRSFGVRRTSFTARPRLGTGTYVARFRSGREKRLVVVRRSGGRFRARPAFVRAKSCDFLSAFRLKAPAFSSKGVRIAYRLAQPARVSVVVRRGRRIVKRYRTARRAPGRTFRLRFKARRRGVYRVTIKARGATRTVRATVGAERL